MTACGPRLNSIMAKKREGPRYQWPVSVTQKLPIMLQNQRHYIQIIVIQYMTTYCTVLP